ncbi:hypothetical protein [Marinobacter alexandrii]|uniref:hypothetical protein n=1 Tax=Marinobacter alexandrii TaxID=2570351 RepID=UPI0032980B1C
MEFATEVQKNACAKRGELQSLPDFGVFAIKVNQILQATPPKLRREMGICGKAANKNKIEKQKHSVRVATATQQRFRRQS